MHRNCLLGMLLYVFSVSLIGTCAPHLTAARTIPPTERDPEETRQAIPPVVLLNGKPLVYTTWEPRRYLRDGRPFLCQVQGDRRPDRAVPVPMARVSWNPGR